MRVLLVLLVAAFCEARPSVDSMARPMLMEPGQGSFVIGGVEAGVNEFPWQLSQQRLGGSWSHSCGASLLSANGALSAAHCVDGANIGVLRVIAGLHSRVNINDGSLSNLASFTMHQGYGDGSVTFANDIAILRLASEIGANGVSIAYATLPTDDGNQFAGVIGTISGWGRTSASNTLPENLQKADIEIIGVGECNTLLSPVTGATTGSGQICLYDRTNRIGSCNGDSGGPLNVNQNGRVIVAGVTSWGISSGGACLQDYPSIYSRTSFYLDWIRANNPLM